jgi:hypothetical protein
VEANVADFLEASAIGITFLLDDFYSWIDADDSCIAALREGKN